MTLLTGAGAVSHADPIGRAQPAFDRVRPRAGQRGADSVGCAVARSGELLSRSTVVHESQA